MSASPLLEPLDTSVIACVPVTRPAVAVFAPPPSPTARLELFDEPPERFENEPELLLAAPLDVPNEALRPSV